MDKKFVKLNKEELPQGGLLWNMACAFELIGQKFECYIYKYVDDKSRIDLDLDNDDVYVSYTFDGYGKELLSFYMSGKNYHIGE